MLLFINMQKQIRAKQLPSQPASQFLFQVKCKLNKQIRTTKNYWRRITQVKHPQLKNKTAKAKQVLQNPDLIRQSKADKKVYLYYRKQNKHYLCVVAKHSDGAGFIITSYLTSKILEGKLIWTKKSKQ